MTVLGESMQKAPAVHSRCRGIFYGIFGFFGSVMCACNSLQGEPSRKHLCFLFVSPKTDAVSVNQSPATLASYALRLSSAILRRLGNGNKQVCSRFSRLVRRCAFQAQFSSARKWESKLFCDSRLIRRCAFQALALAARSYI